MLAPVVDAYFKAPTANRLEGIARMEAGLGATLMDRQRLRLRVQDPAVQPQQVAKATPARARGGRADPRLRLVGGDQAA
jgi:hypothetical protein